MKNLNWNESFENDDNSIWEANSCCHDGSSNEDPGSPFQYRLRQRLRANAIEWVEDSDQELMPDESDPRAWESLELAQAELEKDEQGWMDLGSEQAKEDEE